MQLMQQVAKKREIAKSNPVEKDSNGLTGEWNIEEIKRITSRELCSKYTDHDINITYMSVRERGMCSDVLI